MITDKIETGTGSGTGTDTATSTATDTKSEVSAGTAAQSAAEAAVKGAEAATGAPAKAIISTPEPKPVIAVATAEPDKRADPAVHADGKDAAVDANDLSLSTVSGSDRHGPRVEVLLTHVSTGKVLKGLIVRGRQENNTVVLEVAARDKE